MTLLIRLNWKRDSCPPRTREYRLKICLRGGYRNSKNQEKSNEISFKNKSVNYLIDKLESDFDLKTDKVIKEINDRQAIKIDKLNRKYIFDLINMIYLNKDGSIKIEFKRK